MTLHQPVYVKSCLHFKEPLSLRQIPQPAIYLQHQHNHDNQINFKSASPTTRYKHINATITQTTNNDPCTVTFESFLQPRFTFNADIHGSFSPTISVSVSVSDPSSLYLYRRAPIPT